MDKKAEWKIALDILSNVDEKLLDRIIRKMIYLLYTKNNKEIDDLMSSFENIYNKNDNQEVDLYTNVPGPKKDKADILAIKDKVFEIAEHSLSEKELTKQIKTWFAQEKTRFLAVAFENQNIPLSSAIEEINRYVNIPSEQITLSPEERRGVRVSLIRRFLSNSMSFINIAKEYITIRNFTEILKTVIGPPYGIGKLGGKSAGLLLAYKIIETEKEKNPELKDVQVPKSWYISSDTTLDFIHFNALEEVATLKYMNSDQIRAVYPYLKQLFKNCFFPPNIMHQLQLVLDEVGDKPIIVRSSSLLEDSFQAAFSGKYKSLFLANIGTREEQLHALLDAIAEIYASVFGPDPIEYRRERGLLDFNEEMGILIQEVVGTKIGKYYFPSFAGVAFSRNVFRWSPRIQLEDGVVRIVAGLGTRAVDRIGDDYPFLASPGKPGIRVNIDQKDIIKYSQRKIDLINLETGKFETQDILEVIKEYEYEIPALEQIVSVIKEGVISAPFSNIYNSQDADYIVTFQALTEKTMFLKQMHLILKILEGALKTPVDVEFAHDGKRLYILQCRPQMFSRFSEEVTIPANIPNDRILFLANKYITTGSVKDARFVVYVDPDQYDLLPELAQMKRTAEVVSKLNQVLPRRKFVLIGPGRWGSRGDVRLGVPVTYSDINNTSLLIEMSCLKGDYVPELSFGTHFFQDLVEANIKYLPIYPGRGKDYFKTEMLLTHKNHLAEILPDYADMEHVVKVIDVCDFNESAKLITLMDGEKSKAVGYLFVESDEQLL
jgi:pyruvate,water dikinase